MIRIVVKGTAESTGFKCQVPKCGGSIAFTKYGSSDEEIWTCDKCGQAHSCAEEHDESCNDCNEG